MPSWDQNSTVCEPLMNLFHLWLLLLLLLLQSHSHVSAQQPPTEPDSHLRSPLTIVIVLIVAAFCITIGFFSIYNRNCAAEVQAADSQGGNCPYRCQGLEPEVIKTFPILHYAAVKHLRIGEEALECAVCLSKFEDCENLRLLLKCYHVFHPNCIDPWLASHVTCPVCRAELVPESKQLESDSTTPAAQLNLDELLEISPRRKLQKSHSTGHDSLDQLEQNRDRYSLRLPEEMSRQLLDTSASSSNTIKSIIVS